MKNNRVINFATKKIDHTSLKAFEKQMREEVGKTRKLTPEFLKGILSEREKYRKVKGSHYGFNNLLADREGVSIKAVEKWVAKAESLPTAKPIQKGKRKVSASKAGSKKTTKGKEKK